jgi:UDP-N-acetylmuramoyl-tripeptide--D-alanyl-D-alanine ligase
MEEKMKLSLNELKNILDGSVVNVADENLNFLDVSTDTRQLKPGALFVPLVGEKFDGHDFIESAFESGAVLTLTEKAVDYPCFIVENTKEAYKEIARYYKEKINPITIGITGSVGKTTTKEIISEVLKRKYNVHTTYKNFNNEIGVAQTILELTQDHEVLVIELGMDHFGEMHELSRMVQPDFVVLTNIGMSHVGNFNSLDDIGKAKFEIFDFCKDDCTAVINGDDLVINEKINKLPYKQKKYGYSKGLEGQVIGFQSKGIYGTKINVKTKVDEYFIETNAIGEHLGYSILPAILLGEILDVSKENIINGIKNFMSSDQRMELIELNEMTIINDAYNASIESIKSAVNTLEETNTYKKRIAFLGDILELGFLDVSTHERVGRFIREKTIDEVIFIGNLMQNAYNEAKENDYNEVFYYPNKWQLKNNIKKHLTEDAIILLKGSRGTKMEEIIDFIKEN